MADDHLYGQEAYEAAGKPLFGRIWTYEELLTVDRPAGRGKTQKTFERPPRPDWFPADTVVDSASWVYWLPEGWYQGVRTQEQSGKILKCYLSPEGKRYWHRKDVDKVWLASGGAPLPTQEVVRPAQEVDGEKRVRYITDPDMIPCWPVDPEGTEWLPRDWRLIMRQLPSRAHRCHMPPGQDDGFYFHKQDVEEWKLGQGKVLTKIEGSRPMQEKYGTTHAKKKRKLGRQTTKVAFEDDYVQDASLVVVDLTNSHDEIAITKLLKASACANADGLASDCTMVRAALIKRNFSEATTLLAVFFKVNEADNPCARYLSGIYYQLAEELNGHAYFQKVKPIDLGVCGKRCWLYWSSKMSEWRIGTIGEQHHGLARCAVDKPPTQLGSSTWKCLQASFFIKQDSGSTSQAETPAPESAADPEIATPAAKKPKAEEKSPEKLSKKTPVAVKKEQVEQKSTSSRSDVSSAAVRPHKAIHAIRADVSGAEKSKTVPDPPPGHTERVWTYDEVQRGEDWDGIARKSFWPHWLPHDWGRSKKENGMGKLMTIYVQPGWQRCCWVKEECMKVIESGLEGQRGSFL